MTFFPATEFLKKFNKCYKKNIPSSSDPHERTCLIQCLTNLQDQYDPVFEKQVQASQVVTINDVKGDRLAKGGFYRLIYHTKDNFKKLAKSLGLMDDFKVSCNQQVMPICIAIRLTIRLLVI